MKFSNAKIAGNFDVDAWDRMWKMWKAVLMHHGSNKLELWKK